MGFSKGSRPVVSFQVVSFQTRCLLSNPKRQTQGALGLRARQAGKGSEHDFGFGATLPGDWRVPHGGGSKDVAGVLLFGRGVPVALPSGSAALSSGNAALFERG